MTSGPVATNVHAIVLAAGAGRRFGGGKLLASWHGAPLLHAALRSAAAAPVNAVTVVLGADGDAIGRAACDFASPRPLRLVEAADWSLGLSASLRAGIEALPPDTRAAFVFLADMPLIPAGVLGPLAAAVLAGSPAAAPVFDGQRGHPVVLGRALLARIDELSGDTGARRLLADVEVFEVPAPCRGVLLDIDTRAALKAAAAEA